MASFVLLIKDYEDDEVVIYRFGPNEKEMGKIKLNKKTNMFSELEAVSQKARTAKFYFDRAAQRLARCVMKENGLFPQRTTFES